jgi:hypothetical protein
MTEGNEAKTQIQVDKTNLLKAGKIPVIVAAIGGALWLVGSPGGFVGVLFWFIAVFAGYWYADRALKSGAKPAIVDVIVNGAILGAAVGLVYAVVGWIALSIRFSGFAGLAFRWGVGSIVRVVLESGLAGAVGAAGWFAYKTGMIKTK